MAQVRSFIAGALEAPLAFFQGFLCRAYQICCRDPALALFAGRRLEDLGSGDAPALPVDNTNTTCLRAHAGESGVNVILRDPSSPKSCPGSHTVHCPHARRTAHAVHLPLGHC